MRTTTFTDIRQTLYHKLYSRESARKYFYANMCSIITKGSGCRKKQKLRFVLILIEQVMTNLLRKKLTF